MKQVFAKFMGVLVAVLVTANPATAAVVTFEGSSNTVYSAPITRSGFVFGNVAGDEQHFHEIASGGFPGFMPSNGTGVLYNDRDTRIFIEDAAAADFVLSSLDVSWADEGGVSTITPNMVISGFLDGLLVGSINFSNGAGFTSVLGGSLGTVDRIVIDGVGASGGFVLDNVSLDAATSTVPEPATLGLVLLGLAGAGVRRRRSA